MSNSERYEEFLNISTHCHPKASPNMASGSHSPSPKDATLEEMSALHRTLRAVKAARKTKNEKLISLLEPNSG